MLQHSELTLSLKRTAPPNHNAVLQVTLLQTVRCAILRSARLSPRTNGDCNLLLGLGPPSRCHTSYLPRPRLVSVGSRHRSICRGVHGCGRSSGSRHSAGRPSGSRSGRPVGRACRRSGHSGNARPTLRTL
eukprot:15447672-Alexandrium_andersonii.AAC.1